MSDLSLRDIKYLQGVGPQRAAILEKELNIRSFKDLLYYFPYKYVDRSRLYYIHEIDGNMPYIQLRGQVLSFETFGEGRQRRLVGHFSDGTGVVDLVWFQGLKFIETFFGWYRGGRFGLVSRLEIHRRQIQGTRALHCFRQADRI